MTVKDSISVQTDVTNIRNLGNKEPCSKSAKKGPNLDTLAQLQTKGEDSPIGPLRNLTKSQDKNPLQKRARRKYLGNALVLKLVDAAKHSDIENRRFLPDKYWNSWHCVDALQESKDGKLSGKYCKLKWCPVCNSIRTAKLINEYKPIFNEWEDPYFVTLTVPNVTGEELERAIKQMTNTFSLLKESHNKQARRKGTKILTGIRKTECTFNVRRNNYHPHFHFLVDGADTAYEIIYQWLERYPECSPNAQDVVKATKGSLIELFKYFTKFITKGPSGKMAIYADALDVVFNAVHRKRTIQTFGFKKPKIEVEDPNEITGEDVLHVHKWIQELGDWANVETGELLSGYIPSEGMKELIQEGIKMRPK